MKVTYFGRKVVPGRVSIERVFATVRDNLPAGVRYSTVECPFERGVWGRLVNMWYCRRRRGQVNHVTGDVHYITLALNKKRTILTIHDCGVLLEYHGLPRELIRLFWFEWPVRRATIVTVISEQTKAEVLRYTSCAEHKVRVIPNPIPSQFVYSEKQFNPLCPILLQVGTFENKNLENVARALRGVKCRLDIVGRLSPLQKSVLDESGVEYTAEADLSDLEILGKYTRADVVLFCSRYEGFGMPIIEANAIGRAVVASDIEPLRSIANGAASMVDPEDIVSIQNGILRVLNDSAYRESLILKGRENARRFCAREIALMYVSAYDSLSTAADGT